MNSKAPESKKILKVRRKLDVQLKQEHALITEAALKRVSCDIKNWISRHTHERIKLKQKNISFFDENQHPEKVHSRFVKDLREKLKRLFEVL